MNFLEHVSEIVFFKKMLHPGGVILTREKSNTTDSYVTNSTKY